MKFLSVIFILFLSLNIHAIDPGNGKASLDLVTIEGKVIDEISGEGLPGAEIRLMGSDKVIYTDFDGNFSFSNILPGNYSISVDYVSYRKKILTGVKPSEGSQNFMIKLKTVAKSSPQTIQSAAPVA